jgi:serine/threonine protein kinase
MIVDSPSAAAPSPSDDVIYQAIASLGRTPLGETTLAAVSGPPGLERLASITSFWPELTETPALAVRLVTQARAAQRLRHPNILRTFEVGADLDAVMAAGAIPATAPQQRCFVASEHVAGQPLGRIMRRLRGNADFTLQLRLEILIEILAGLEYAHDRPDPGSWHGGLHADAVVIGYDGQVKVGGFGLGHALLDEGDRPLASIDELGHTAPEPLHGRTSDHRADLLAVGLLLWELLAERPMFPGRSGLQMLAALGGDLPLPALPAGPLIPAGLARICQQALQRDPDQRYQRAFDFRCDLDEQLTSVLPWESRALGKVVSNAFRAEKQHLEALIDRFFSPQAVAPTAPNEVMVEGATDFSVATAIVTAAAPPPQPPAPLANVPSYLTDRITGSVPAVEVPGAGLAAPAATSGWMRVALLAGAVVVGAAITFALAGPARVRWARSTAVSATSVSVSQSPALSSLAPAPAKIAIAPAPARAKPPPPPLEPTPPRRSTAGPAPAPTAAAAITEPGIDPENPYRP